MQVYDVTFYCDNHNYIQEGYIDENMENYIVVASSLENAAITACNQMNLNVEKLEEADYNKPYDYEIEHKGFKYQIWITFSHQKILIGD